PRLLCEDGAYWLTRLEREHDNLRAVLEWCSSEDDGLLIGLRMCTVLSEFWESRGHITEGRQRLTRLLARTETLPPTPERARALGCASRMASSQYDYALARRWGAEGLAMARELGDDLGVTTCSLGSTWCAICEGDYAYAREVVQESLKWGQDRGDTKLTLFSV